MLHKNLAPQDAHSPSQEQVENNTLTDIPALRCLTYAGIGTLYPSVSLATPGSDIRGISQSIIQAGSRGYVLVYGMTYNIDTSAWPVGTSLFCGTNGILTDVSSGPQVANVLKQHATLGVIQVTCLDTPASGISSIQDTDSIDLDTTGLILKGDLRLSTNAASVDNMKATTTIKSGPSKGLHIEYPFSTTSQDGILKAVDWTTFNDKVEQTDPRLSTNNVLRVKTNPGTGEFSSIKAAVDSITTASSSNLFIVEVAPRVWIEDTITMKPYVWVTGIADTQTVIQVNATSKNVITGAPFSGISHVVLTGATDVGKCGIYFTTSNPSPGAVFLVDDVRFGSNNILVKSEGIIEESQVFINNAKFGADGVFNQGFIAKSSGASGRIQIRGSTSTSGLPLPLPTDICVSDGVDSQIVVNSFQVRSKNGLAGTCFRVRDGGALRLLSVNLSDFTTGIWVENVGAAPILRCDAMAFENCTTDILVEHPGAVGYVSRPSDFTKININTSSSVFIPGKDLNVITVAKKGEDFTSIEAAVAAAVNSGPSNRYLIRVGAGTFNENPIIIPPYVSIEGSSIQTTIVSPIDPTEHLFSVAEGVEISFLSMYGVAGSLGSGKAAVYAEDIGDFAQIHKVSIYDFDIGIDNYSNTAASIIYVEYVDINGDYSYAFRNRSPNGFENRLQLENTYSYSSSSAIQTCVLSDGATASLLLHLAGFFGAPGQIGVNLRNGGTADISATFFQDIGDIAVWSENVGAGAKLEIDGTSFRNCTRDIVIDNAGTSGFFVGYRDIQKTTIDVNSSFFIANEDSNILTVAKKGGDFTSVKDALDFITAPSATNQYIVSVGPGVFAENQITGKEYVTLVGSGTTITAIDPSIPLLIGADAFIVTDITFDGVTDAGVPTIYYESQGNNIGSTCQFENVSFLTADTLVHIKGTVYPTVAVFRHTTIGGINTFDVGFKCEDAGAGFTQLNIDSLLYQRNSASYPSKMISIMGVGSELNLFNSGVRNDSPVGTFLEIQDGANVRVAGCLVSGYDKALHVINAGVAPTVRFGTTQVDNSGTYDILVEHPGTTGAITGGYDTSKILIDNSSTVAINLSDPVNGGAEVVGPLRLGTKHSNVTDVTDLIQLSSPSGTLFGGAVSNSINPLDISVAAGFGYVADATTERLKKVTWSTTIITLANNINNYIYINNMGVPTSSTSVPALNQTILLARVRTAGGNVVFRSQIPYKAKNAASALDEFLRTALGPIYVSGSILTENLSTPRAIDITAGQYWFSRLKFLPVGGTNVNYSDFYHVSGVLTQTTSSVLDNTQYDNGTDLVSLTTGYYTKHVIYIAGDDGDETYALIRGQAEYATLLDAQLADLPTPPPFFQDITAPLFALIMQEGTNSIVDIINIQPRVGFQSPTTSGSADHGSLLGLLDDDHTQYLLVNGGRALTGNLDMGGNSITNVNLVDGIDVTAHAARHNFNGSDPLLSAVPQTIGSTNLEGTDNSHVSRADHVHAHGNLGGGSTHAAVTTSVNGYMSAADKVKLDGVATGATANATDAQLRDRATHTGTQTASTISDFSTAADARITLQKGAAGGIATLDGTVHIPIAQILTAAPSTQIPDQANAIGTSSSVARADHIHNIPTAAPVTASADGTNGQGVATTFARADHKHDIATGTPSSQAPDQANAAGVSSNLARADHIHNIPAAAPITNLSPATTNAEGTGVSFARNDHTHAIEVGIVGDMTTIQPDATAAAGTIDRFARADHRHAIITDAPTTILSPATTNSEGVSTSFTRSDHTHSIATGLVGEIVTIQPDDTAAAGTVDKFARVDHRHAIAAASAITIDISTTNTEGVSTSFARADHTHKVNINNSRVASTTLITTTSTTYVVMTGQTLTPAAGTYWVNARANVTATSNNRLINFSIFSNGSIIADTEMWTFIRTGSGFLGGTSDTSPLHTEAFITVNGSQAIDMRWFTSGGTAQAQGYSLALIKVA